MTDEELKQFNQYKDIYGWSNKEESNSVDAYDSIWNDAKKNASRMPILQNTVILPEKQGNEYAINYQGNVEPTRPSNNNNDSVVHPSHYQSSLGIETIDVEEAFTEDLVGIEAADTSNIIKYVCRWHKKNGIKDLRKAKMHLEHLIEHLENKENNIQIKFIKTYVKKENN